MRAEYRTQMQADKIFYGDPSLRTQAVRLPEIYTAKFEVFASLEGTKISDLHREGILRVINDRQRDAEYMHGLVLRTPQENKFNVQAVEELRTIGAAHASVIEARLAVIKALRQE